MKKLTKILVTSAILLMATVATKATPTVGLFVENEQARIFRFQIESGGGTVFYFVVEVDGTPFHFNNNLNITDFYLFSLPEGIEYKLTHARTTAGEECIIDTQHQVVHLGGAVQVNLDLPPTICQNGEKIDLNEKFTCNVPYQERWYTGDGITQGHFFDPRLTEPGLKPISVTVVYCGQEYGHTAFTQVLEMPELEIRGIPSSVIYNTTDPFVVWGSPSGGTLKIDGATTNTFNPNSLEIGDHTISYEYRAQNGCSDIITKVVHIYKWTSLEEVCEDVKTYPNPVKDKLVIESQEIIGNVKIYNTMGTLVYSQNCPNNTLQIDLSDLSSGIYLIESKIFRQKIIKL